MKALNSFEYDMQLDAEHPILTDHRVHGERIMPGVTFLDMIAKLLLSEGLDAAEYHLSRIVFRTPIKLAPGDSCTVKVSYSSDDQSIKVVSYLKGTWIEHCRCVLQAGALPATSPFAITELKRNAHQTRDLHAVYQQAKQLEINHGPFMQGEGAAYLGRDADGSDYVLAEIALSAVAQQSAQDYFAHPALLDSMTVVPFAAGLAGGISSNPYIPIAIDKFSLTRPLGNSVCVLAKIAQDGTASDDVLHNHIWLLSPTGEVIGQFSRLTAKRIRSAASITRNTPAPQKPAQVPGSLPLSLHQTLAELIAAQLQVATASINADEVFYELGLDSSSLLELVSKLEARFNTAFYPTMLFEHNTLNKVVTYLQGLIDTGALALPDAGQSAATTLATPARQAVAPAVSVTAIIATKIAAMLGVAGALDEHKGFYDLGLDSNQLLALASELERTFVVQLYPTLLFEYNTIAQLGGYIETLPISLETTVGVVAETAVVEPADTLVPALFTQHWAAQALPALAAVSSGTYLVFGDKGIARSASQLLANKHHLLLENLHAFSPEFAGTLSASMAAQSSLAGLVWCVPVAHYDETLSMALSIAQTAMASGKSLAIYVIAQAGNPAGYALTGFWKSLRHEVNRLNIRQIFCAKVEYLPLAAELDLAPRAVEVVSYESGARSLQQLEQLAVDISLPLPPLDGAITHGAIVISGGLGSIGMACVRHLFARGCHAFALIGRSEPDVAVVEELEALRHAGAEILCLQANVANFPQLQSAWRKIKNRFGDVTGVIHTAGVLRDALVKDKTLAQANAVLAGKLTGAENLDLLSSSEPLGFFVNCGSIAGVLGNLGQSDYAFANAALEAFALRRQKMVQRGERFGRSLTIHWPLWRDGGMSLNEARSAQLRSLTGLEQMTEAQAMQCFDWLLFGNSLSAPACLPVVGNMAQFAQHLSQLGFINSQPVPAAELPAPMDVASAPVALASTVDTEADAIAIIGLAGVYPQAESIEAFWQNILAGVDAITEIPASRWDHEALVNKSGAANLYSRWGGFIEQVEQFDAEFFGITPREAELMDPQERLFLQTAWNTFEDAGIPLSQIPNSAVGVFVGAMWSQYQLLSVGANDERKTASIFSAIANRVSYSLNLKGPSMALDTMCSSALSALHIALESVRRGDCAMALVGGVNIMSHPHKYQFLCQNKMLASDGRCRSFGKDGSGYVPGEGVGAVLIKPLAAALRDGDNIHAVIRGSALSHGGRVAGMTVPHPVAQAEVIQKALDNSGVSAAEVSLIEAHGTGTSLGDPIELDGLKKVFSNNTQPISLGSVKSNIGHLESAAGIAALSKVVLQLKNACWVPSLHSRELNPKLRFDTTSIRVQQTFEPWRTEGRRIAGISAFGAGGSNAHVVVEEFVSAARAAVDAPVIIPLSARDPATLVRYAQAWRSYLSGERALAGNARLVDIAYTAQTGRDSMEYRLALVGSSLEEVVAQLDLFLANENTETFSSALLQTRQPAPLVALAQAYMAGNTVAWPLLPDAAPVRTSIPVYPFQGPAYWYPRSPELNLNPQDSFSHSLLQRVLPRVDGAHFSTHVTPALPLVAQHQINKRYLLPGAASLTMMVEAVRAMGSDYPLRVQQFTLAAPVDVTDQLVEVTTAAYAALSPDTLLCEVSSGELVQTIHAQARIISGTAESLPMASAPLDWQPADDLYRQFTAKQFSYGALFQQIEGVSLITQDCAWVKLRNLNDLDAVTASVVAIDAAMQASVVLQDDITRDPMSYLPYQLNNVTYVGELAQARYIAVSRLSTTANERHFALDIYAADGKCLWRAAQFVLRASALATLEVAAPIPALMAPAVSAELASDTLRKAVKNWVVDGLAVQTGLTSRVILKADTFDQVGIDSIAIMNVTATLEAVTGSLPKTLFFECPSVSVLSDYLLANYLDVLSQHFAEGTPKPVPVLPAASTTQAAAKPLVSFARQRRAQGQSASHPSAREPIAIIGLAGRYPDAETPEQLWQNLSAGRDSVISVPAERWDVERYFNADKNHNHTTYCRNGGFISKAEYFDPAFFNITPADAIVADPQERLFLQTAWHALEDAGYAREAISGKAVGVFAAVMWNQYQLYGLDKVLAGDQAGALSVASAIANRLSYTMNIQGPSLTLDTMCSSSLTALHLAAQAIWNGDCETAFVGGVNLSLHPHKYLSLCSNNFLSARGRCSAFGENADGYVPAEGVGVVYVKPLAQAEADGDHIYGVIRATAVNHVGRTSGATVPSPDAQAALIQRALQQAEIDPHSISYVEAHGTGTALGDPIEIRGLNKALNADGVHPGCRIGSIKANIGHAESAAGIASLTKVLMQMRHGQIAPSLHSTPLNPKIEFSDTPFDVNQALCAWDTPAGNPRRAGISSFGAGGSNAHIVVEEYLDQRAATTAQASNLLVLSARTKAQLSANASRLLGWMQANPQADLTEVCFTLQAGREAFDHRFAVEVSSLALAIDHLQAAIDSNFEAGQGIYRAQSQLDDEAELFEDEDGQEYLERLLLKQRWSGLARLWCRGISVDWARCYQGFVRRISLPGYAFAEQKLMFDIGLETSLGVDGHLQNISDIYSQAYRSRLSATHPSLADHHIGGHSVVSMAWLASLVNSAVHQAAPDGIWEIGALNLERVLLVSGEQLELELVIEPVSDNQLEASIYHISELQGQRSETRVATAAVRRRMQSANYLDQLAGAAMVSADNLYSDFAKAGFCYGKSYHRVAQFALGDTQVRASLAAGHRYFNDLADAGTIDAALQLTRLFTTEGSGAWFPKTLGGFWFDASASASSLAVEKIAEQDGQLAFRLFWLDQTGALVGYCDQFLLANERAAAQSSKPVVASAQNNASNNATQSNGFESGDSQVSLIARQWVDANSLDARYRSANISSSTAPVWVINPDQSWLADNTAQVVIRWGDENRQVSAAEWQVQANEAGMQFLVERLQGSEPVILLGANQVHDGEEQLYWNLWHLVRQAMKASINNLKLVVAAINSAPQILALPSWMHTVAEERPGYQMRVALSGQPLHVSQWLAPLTASMKLSRYTQSGNWQVRGFTSLGLATDKPVPLSGQTVLITGGAGGLGSLFARHLAAKHGCNLVLVGRKAINDDIRTLLADLRRHDVEAVYYSSSMGDADSMAALSRKIELRFGQLDGVVHAAGFNCDSYIFRQSAANVEQVLAPKVSGTRYLIQLLQTLSNGNPTAWMLGFSSISGFLGHAGQADYSFANAYMDEALLAAEGIKGLTINWPLWDGVGMQISPKLVKMLEQQTGMQPLPVAHGLALFDQILASGIAQVLPIYGKTAAVKQWFNAMLPGEFAAEANLVVAPHNPLEIDVPACSEPALDEAQSTPVAARQPETVAVGRSTTDTVRLLVAEVVASENGLAQAAIEWERGLDSYGFSSVAVSAMTHQLEKVLGELPKTLFFECRTLTALVKYLVENHSSALAPIPATTAAESLPVVQQAAAITPTVPASTRRLSGQARHSRFNTKATVAIVGAAGRFPQADNLEELWQHLLQGNDCVTPVPQDRWNTGDNFDAGLKGGFIRDIDKFDAKFFGISRNEATATDPHERLLLQSVWHSLEDAGLQPKQLAGQKVGVYVGAMWGQYQLQGLDAWRQGKTDIAVSSYASIANRISYFFDFKGPSVTLDSMCSSSILALKFAVDALQNGEIDYAVVGGVNSSVHPYKYRQLKESMFLSSEGRCRAFGAGGDGYVPGEGIISLVLCRDNTAGASDLRVRALVKGIAIAHGGNGNGYYVPNPDEQAEVIRQALVNANIAPQTISYVEAHGTGTALGDPIEIRGLQKSYFAEQKFPCAIGSIKANIGHLESAAGLASICKVLLQMEHDQLVPSIHSTPENPNINFAATGLSVQRSVSRWSEIAESNPLRAGISSFGAGGTNSHLILEAPAALSAQPTTSTAAQLFVVSAKDVASLKQLVQSYSQWLADSKHSLLHIAAASQNLRQPQEVRSYFIAQDCADLQQQLRAWLQSPSHTRVAIANEQFSLSADANLEQLQHAAAAWFAGQALVHACKVHQPLPKYVFAKERFWVDVNVSGANAIAAVQPQLNSAPAVAQANAVQSRPAAAPRQSVADEITNIVAQTLGLDASEMDEQEGFESYGVDSVQASEIAEALGKLLGTSISPTVFYNYPNLAALTAYLCANFSLAVQEQPAPVAVQEQHNSVQLPQAATEKTLTTSSEQNTDIAIIGMSGAFAGADNLARLWENLKAGVDSVAEVPASRWQLDDFYDAVPGTAGKTYSRRMGLMSDIDKFDPAFFGLMAEEAIAMDPQQRLFLLHAFRAIEDAGINRDHLQGSKTGVFCGAMTSSYRELLPDSEKLTAFSMMGNHTAVMPARVSYWLNLIGPSLVVDTACSSASLAIHLACQSIKSGESTMALAGGVSIFPGPQEQIGSSSAGMLSREGSCKTFSDSANGVAIGEGVGVVMLKSLAQAIADGDPIHAVIKATGVNQDGKTNGLTAPSAAAQGQLLCDVLSSAKLNPADIQYIETHGTGTRMGDPVEIDGLTQAFGNAPGHILLGSIKPNIGHCYAAAGIANIVKAVMAVKNSEIPPSIHATPHNTLIDFERLPFRINTELRAWPVCTTRRAGISAFGYSGTNVHIIIQEAPAQIAQPIAASNQPLLLPLSARSAECLIQQASELAHYLLTNPATHLQSFTYTLQVGRKALDYRRCLMVSNVADAIEQLQRIAATNSAIPRIEKRSLRPATSAGAQCFAACDWATFASLWEKGMQWDWAKDQSVRLHLPASALELKPYWPQPLTAPALPANVSIANQPECYPAIALVELTRNDFKKIA